MYKYAVFDLDETLGHFTQLGIFWDSLSAILKTKLTQSHFNDLCNMFPNFFRPGIFTIISYILRIKSKNPHIKIVIYTNNQAPKKWTYMIKEYIEHKLNNTSIFDNIICAFKVNGKRVEMCRTTHNKTVKDLVRCTKAPKHSRFVFLDDQYHEKMKNEVVDYINVKPYNYHMSYPKMLNIFVNSGLGKLLLNANNMKEDHFKSIMMRELKRYNFHVVEKSDEELNIDKIVTKKMMVHLQNFFGKHKSKKNKTKKKRNYNPLNRSKRSRKM